MAQLQVTCITKRPSHYDAHTQIQALGGAGLYKAEDTVIGEIERQTNSYFVSVGGRTVWVIVATHLGRKYLKTEADGYSPDNLLSLPECPEGAAGGSHG